MKAAKQEDSSNEIQEVFSFYGDDFQEMDLNTQLQIFGTKFIGESCSLNDILAFSMDFLMVNELSFIKCVGLLNLL